MALRPFHTIQKWNRIIFASNESFTHRAHSSNLSSADSEFQVLKPTADTESSAVTGLSAEEIRESSQEKPSKRASLCDLPNELLGSIEQYISVVDACCVAICNRRLKQAFGYRYDECISKPSMKNERGNFLALIAADFSAYFYCIFKRIPNILFSNKLYSRYNS